MSEPYGSNGQHSTGAMGGLRRFVANASDRALLGLGIIAVSGGLLVCLFTVYVVNWVGSSSVVGETAVSPQAFNNAQQPDQPTTLSPTAESFVVNTENSTTIVMDTGTQAGGLQVAAPQQIRIGAETIGIVPETVSASALLEGATHSEVRWVQNSVVNYVVQLPNTAVYQTLLQSLQTGDTIELVGSGGDLKTYVVETVNQAELTPNTLRQDAPAITLILASNTPLVVRGLFTAADGAAPLPERAQAAVSLGETAVIGDVTLTVQQAIQDTDALNLPTGFLLYQVEYELSNIGTESLDSGWFELVLRDDSANQYQNQNAIAASRVLEPGQVLQQTAVYQIPANLTTTGFNLAVSRIDGPATLDVALPFTAAPNQATQIDLVDVQLAPDGTRLLITGEISNLGVQTLTIQSSDIGLTNGQTAYLVFETTPALPWVIEPGSAQSFLLNTQRPDAAEAQLRVASQPFLLQNLR